VTSFERELRDLAPRVLSALVRRYRDLGACEDALQEALLSAAQQWPTEGRPEDGRAWLFRVASRRVVDHVRAEAARRRRESLVVSLVPAEQQLALAEGGGDDTLELFFLCCHPALTSSSAVALTLRAVGGLTTAEIARAFLVPEATMGQRLSRARQAIKSSGLPFASDALHDRLGRVMHVLYLIFNEGYVASAGPSLQRADLSSEALRLARLLLKVSLGEPEVMGLLALMLLTDARREARTGPAGELIPLDRQDRARWDRAEIEEGTALVTESFARGNIGPYQLQAAIASLHDEATSTDATDWAQIEALYSVLLRLGDSPMAALSHAIALAMVEGAAAGLDRLEALSRDARLQGHHRLQAARAHLLERAGDRAGAIAAFERAAQGTASTVERDYLLLEAARLRGG
jgi:predicted RNA polymerase sigma factor